MKRTIALLIMMIIGLKLIYAQNGIVPGSLQYYEFSRLFSQTYTAGTARMQAIGGAQISLGGDLSVASNNPAGLGFFNRSSFALTPSLDFHSSDANFEGRTVEDFGSNFNFGHLGIGFHHQGNGAYQGGTFAISLSRNNNFHNKIGFDGLDRNSENGAQTIIEDYLINAGGNFPEELSEELFLALDQALIEQKFLRNGDETDDYESFILGTPRQRGQLTTSGRQQQLDLSYGGNYEDKIYFGLGIGLSTLRYTETLDYQEDDFQINGQPESVVNSIFRSVTYNADGIGSNATLGITIRPISTFRFGLVAKTPTFYNIKDRGSLYLESIDSQNIFEGNAPSTNFDYTLRTPWKFSAGASYFIGKYGFVSADIDYLNYSDSKLNSNSFGFSFIEDNQTIKNIYTSAINYRIGGEYRLGSIMLRGGYGVIGNPLKDQEFGSTIQRVSGGIGYRNQNMFIDLSVVHSTFDSKLTPFESASVVNAKNKNVNISATLGFNF